MSSTILVPIDFSDVTDKLLWEAVRLGRGLGAAVRLIHAMPPQPAHVVGAVPGWPAMLDTIEKDRQAAGKELDDCAQLVSSEGLDASAEVVVGPPARVILEAAARLEPELIVLGSHGHGLMHHLVLGSVTADVLKRAICPVVVVPSRVVAAEPIGGGER